ISVQCRRPGVKIEYRRGYRIPKEDERTLDTVVAGFLEPERRSNPMGTEITQATSTNARQRPATMLDLTYAPPVETGATDGRPVCEVTDRSPGCLVDLGPDPRVHLLELLRSDAGGRVTERVARWVNRPGIEPEVLVGGGCDEKNLVCDFVLTWAHPAKLDP